MERATHFVLIGIVSQIEFEFRPKGPEEEREGWVRMSSLCSHMTCSTSGKEETLGYLI